jgi:hypothetical protein
MKRVNVMLDDDTFHGLRREGNGNLSAAIRKIWRQRTAT